MARAVLSSISIGQVTRCTMRNGYPVVKVRVPKMSLDVNLLMYFPKKKDVWCADLKKESLVGDIVVITNIEKQEKMDIHHQVDSILYKCGAVIDPVTGRLCRGTQFVDEEARKSEQSNRVVENLTISRKVEF